MIVKFDYITIEHDTTQLTSEDLFREIRLGLLIM